MGSLAGAKALTLEEAAVIKSLLVSTALHQHQIAAIVGCNQGRVSEIKTGKRFASVAPAEHMPAEQGASR